MKAGAELQREVEAGFTTEYSSWAEVLAKWGNVLVSKLAVIVKQRPDGTERVRIIIDMLRSGLNLFVQLEERIVLPRLRDAVGNLVFLLSALEQGEEVEQIVADFSDAFHTIPVLESERPLQLARRDSKRFVGFDTVVFGGGGSPLV